MSIMVNVEHESHVLLFDMANTRNVLILFKSRVVREKERTVKDRSKLPGFIAKGVNVYATELFELFEFCNVRLCTKNVAGFIVSEKYNVTKPEFMSKSKFIRTGSVVSGV